jgi:uncharacterized protein YuzE
MRVTYDRSADAAYIELGDFRKPPPTWPRADWTYPCDPAVVKGMINVDFDSEGRLIGVEVIDASKKLLPELLDSAVSLSG